MWVFLGGFFLGFFGWVFLGGFFWVGFLMPTLTVTHSGVILSCSRASPAVHPAGAAVAGSPAMFHRPVWMRAAALCPAAAPPYPASPGRRNPWAIPPPAMRTAS